MRINGTGTDRPFGCKPAGRIKSTRFVYKDASAACIYQFAPLTAEADGGVVPAAAAGYICGTSLQYSATGTAGWILMADDPEQLYEIQGDDTGTHTPSQADVGSLADLVSTHTPNLHVSAIELDTSDINQANADSSFLIVGKNESDEWGQYVRYLVKIHYHQRLDTTGV